VQSLHAGAPTDLPDPTFKAQLKEQLMESAMPITVAFPRRPRNTPPGRVLPSVVGRIRPGAAGGLVGRWVAIAATIALLVATALGARFGGILPSDNEPKSTRIAAPFAATPESGTPAPDFCAGVSVYLPCGNAADEVGFGSISLERYDADDLTVSKSQMQGWELDGSQSITFSDPITPVSGVAIDVVVFGAYRATFSEPVVVTRLYPGGGGPIEYPDANTLIELGSGDSVTYQIGVKNEVANPFSTKTLKFKTVLFYEGDPSPENLMAGGNYRTRVDGDGTLPKALNEYSTPEVAIMITYASIIPGHPFPGDGTYADVVLGPVASTLIGGSPDEGFVVWIYTIAG
jgi:hypothetical protein